MKGKIYVGIGGWTYEPWCGPFYPEGLPHKRELEFASRRLTSIEINGTYYRSQTPETFAKWRDETPAGFVFSVKAPRFATNRRVLAEAGESIEKFFKSGVMELKEKLGPINWQFMPTKKFDAADFEAFLKLLPKEQDGAKLRHAIEVRHESFGVPEFMALAKKHNCAVVVADSAKYPMFADVTGDFVYARLENAKAEIETGYAPKDIARWARIATSWSEGGEGEGLKRIGAAPAKKKRDVFVYMINGAKERAPAAATALLAKLK